LAAHFDGPFIIGGLFALQLLVLMRVILMKMCKYGMVTMLFPFLVSILLISMVLQIVHSIPKLTKRGTTMLLHMASVHLPLMIPLSLIRSIIQM
jgi:hypothetical protein